MDESTTGSAASGATKRCSHCRRLLPFTAYSRASARPDGLALQCKACHKEYRTAAIVRSPQPPPPGATKTCISCGEVKPPEAFAKRREQPDGLRSDCRACRAARRKRQYADNEALRQNAQERARAARARDPEGDRARCRTWAARNREYKRQRGRAWYWANPEQRRAAARAYHAVHRAHHQETMRAAYANDPEGYKARVRRWQKTNPDKIRAYRQRREARERGAPLRDLTADQWAYLLAIYGHRCAYCRRRTRLTQDHIVPLCHGGAHTAANVVPACRSCNSRKGKGPPTEYQPPLFCSETPV